MIETRKLAKSYGTFHALRGIDLQVDAGSIYGFVGPNGAGKTTTIRILTTLLEPTSGEARIAGIDVVREREKIRGLVGYLPDHFGVYRDMTVDEYLQFFAAAYGIAPRERTSLVGGLLELVDLVPKKHALIETLSRGMQQRLGLARTLVHDPRVLVLDEPASGLDPRARVEIREILKELQRMGKTILLSSHILPELETLCTRIGILERGELVAEGTVPEVIAKAARQATIRLRSTDDARAEVVLGGIPGVVSVSRDADDGLSLSVSRDLDLARLGETLGARGIWLRHLEQREPSLEEVFLGLTRSVTP